MLHSRTREYRQTITAANHPQIESLVSRHDPLLSNSSQLLAKSAEPSADLHLIRNSDRVTFATFS